MERLLLFLRISNASDTGLNTTFTGRDLFISGHPKRVTLIGDGSAVVIKNRFNNYVNLI